MPKQEEKERPTFQKHALQKAENKLSFLFLFFPIKRWEELPKNKTNNNKKKPKYLQVKVSQCCRKDAITNKNICAVLQSHESGLCQQVILVLHERASQSHPVQHMTHAEADAEIQKAFLKAFFFPYSLRMYFNS